MFHATVIGNSGRDAEVRFTSSGKAICSFSICASESRRRRDSQNFAAIWLECELWGQFAEETAARIKKGTEVIVVGDIRQDKYTTKAGDERTKLVCAVHKLRVLTRDEKPEAQPQAGSADVYDDDIPF